MELIKVNNGVIELDSRMIAEHFGKRHTHVLADIRDEISKLENAGLGGEPIFRLGEYTDKNNQKRPCYTMTEEGALQLGARYDAVARRKLIIKIKELKEKHQRPKIDSSFLYKLAGELEEKEKQIELMRPKEVFADAVATSKTSILVGELAKLLKQNGVPLGQNRLFKLLRGRGYLIKREGTDYNMPTQRSMELGLFEVKETAITHSDGHISINKTPKVTGKGQVYFINKLKEAN